MRLIPPLVEQLLRTFPLFRVGVLMEIAVPIIGAMTTTTTTMRKRGCRGRGVPFLRTRALAMRVHGWIGNGSGTCTLSSLRFALLMGGFRLSTRLPFVDNVCFDIFIRIHPLRTKNIYNFSDCWMFGSSDIWISSELSGTDGSYERRAFAR